MVSDVMYFGDVNVFKTLKAAACANNGCGKVHLEI